MQCSSSLTRPDLAESHAWCVQQLQARVPIDVVARALDHAAIRDRAAPLYLFARLGTERAHAAAALEGGARALDAWEDRLMRAFHGDADEPLFVALADVVQRASIPITPLLDMLMGFRVELGHRGFATFSELRTYCERSGGSAGRLILHALGHDDPHALARAADLGIAARLADIIDDHREDAARGRIYFPREDLEAFQVDEALLEAGDADVRVRELLRFQVQRARAWLFRAEPLLRTPSPTLRRVVERVWATTSESLDRLAPASDRA